MKTDAPSYHGYRFPPEIISHAVWLYHRFCVSFRNVEELLAQRGITVSYEAVRLWCIKFGPEYARRLKRRQGRLGDTWHLDEVFIKIQGERQYLWRAVDQDGDVIDILVQPRRDQKAAKRFFRKLLKGQGRPPWQLVTDKLRSYSAAHREVMPSVVHDTDQYRNNLAEVSHEPTRQRERQMRKFKAPGQAQRFLTVHGLVQNLFRVGRHLLQAHHHRELRDRAFIVWQEVTCAPRPRRRNPGRQRKYSNHAIETAVTLGMVFHLSSRQSEGLLRSLFALMKLDNDVPDHTTISRRKAKLGKVPFYQDKQKTPLHILIDSSGLAVHAGQLRRAPNSRDYRKLHLCVDEQTGEVVAGELTSKRARDSSRVASLVGQIDSPISSARADTAYDASGVYEAIENHSAHRSPRVLIPPRKGAQLASGPASSRQRNRNIAAQARLGKRKWHTESGYSKRSKVETTFHRYKATVGSAMRARGLAARRVEARIGCKILNTMTALGMPDSEMIG